MDTKFRRIIRVKKNNTANLKNSPLRYFRRRFLHGVFDGNLYKFKQIDPIWFGWTDPSTPLPYAQDD